jgi:hypothetical protein
VCVGLAVSVRVPAYEPSKLCVMYATNIVWLYVITCVNFNFRTFFDNTKALESFEVEEEGRGWGGENKSADGSTILELHGWLCRKEDDNYTSFKL